MSPSRRDNATLVVGGEPRIDFLPIETKQRKANRRRRRSYVALVIAIVAVCALAVAFTAKRTVDAQASLQAEQARTSEILQEQREYAEVITVTNDTQAVTNARLVGSANDILWADVIADMFATHDGAYAFSFSVDSQSALEPPLLLEEPLQKPAIATIFLHLEVPTLDQVDSVIAKLPEMPAFADATATSTKWDEEKAIYVVDITLHINADALERRYFTTELESDSDSSDSDTKDEN